MSVARTVLVEAVRVGVVGVCVGAALVVVRGTPPLASFHDESASCAPPSAVRTEIAWIGCDDAAALVTSPEVSFVDARAPHDYETGHVPSALSLPIQSGALPPGAASLLAGTRTVIAYCDASADCEESRRLAEVLASAGVPDVRVLRGGMPAWLEDGHPAESGPCRVCP